MEIKFQCRKCQEYFVKGQAYTDDKGYPYCSECAEDTIVWQKENSASTGDYSHVFLFCASTIKEYNDVQANASVEDTRGPERD